MYSDTIVQKKYLRLIQLKRDEMINLGKRFGLTDEKTVSCSQELDKLLNEYTQFQKETMRKPKPNMIREMSFIIYKSKLIKNKRKVAKYNELKAI